MLRSAQPMMMHQHQAPQHPLYQQQQQQSPAASNTPAAATRIGSNNRIAKRKAEGQDNERLSKRLSLLNLERNGPKLYVPVEAPSASSSSPFISSTSATTPAQNSGIASDNSLMHVDNSKHKVYIYNIDDELSSESDADSDDASAGKLVFLRDIDKHLRLNRIPPAVMANEDGELAGMQMVLYQEPKALSVPEEKDGVRRAVIEARHRLRQRQQNGGEENAEVDMITSTPTPETDAQASSVIDDDIDMDVMDMD